MRGILVIENMNFIKKRISKLSIYVHDKCKIYDATESIIDIALFQIGHFMEFIRYLFDANNTISVFMENKVLMGF